jgi:hypothetical protein
VTEEGRDVPGFLESTWTFLKRPSEMLGVRILLDTPVRCSLEAEYRDGSAYDYWNCEFRIFYYAECRLEA